MSSLHLSGVLFQASIIALIHACWPQHVSDCFESYKKQIRELLKVEDVQTATTQTEEVIKKRSVGRIFF